MIEIKAIFVYKDGFLIKAPNIEDESNGLIKPYLVVFNQKYNDKTVHLIANHAYGKPKGEDRRCPKEILIKEYEYDEIEYKKKIYNSLLYPTKREGRLKEGTMFALYRINTRRKRAELIDGKDGIKSRYKLINSFFHGEVDKEDKKFYFWLGDYKTTDIILKKEISVYDEYDGVATPKEKKKETLQGVKELKTSISDQETDSLFSNDFREYVRFECKTEDINQNLLGKKAGFGVQDTNKFKKYLSRKNYETSIKALIEEGRNVLIQGPPDVGKTRLAYEVLRSESFKGYYVFSFLQKHWPELHKLNFSNSITARKINLIWFIDDLHYFHKDTQGMYDKLISNFDRVIVVATLRSDKTVPDESLIYSMRKVPVKIWSENEIIALAAKNSLSIMPHKIGNTPSWIVNDYEKLRTIYESYKEKGKEHYLNTLRYLELLFEFLESVDYNLLRDTFLHLRDGLSNRDDFERALRGLENVGFIEIKEGYILSKDIFFVEIVADEDYYSMTDDMEKLKIYFVDQKMDARFYYLGNYFGKKKQFGIAIDIFDKAIQAYPNNSFFYNNRGNVYLEKGEYDLAIEDYTKVIEFNANYEKAYYNRANAYYRKGEYDLAIRDFSKTLKINPNYESAYFNCANTYYRKGEYDLAIENYSKTLNINPKNKNAYHFRGNVYYEKAEYNLAIEDYTKVIELDPDYEVAYYNRANAYYRKGEYDLAIADFTKAIEIDSKYESAYYLRGNSYCKKIKYELGIKDFTKVIELNPHNTSAYNGLGNAYDGLGEYDLAIENYTKLIKSDPNHKNAYNNRGIIYWKKNKYDLVIEDFTKVIELDSSDAIALNIRGNAYYEKGEYDLSVEDFTKAIEIDPNYEDAYFNRSSIYAFQKNKHKMLLDLQKAIKLNPNLKESAMEDKNFMRYRDHAEFKQIIK